MKDRGFSRKDIEKIAHELWVLILILIGRGKPHPLSDRKAETKNHEGGRSDPDRPTGGWKF
jgi:hypothetical protein